MLILQARTDELTKLDEPVIRAARRWMIKLYTRDVFHVRDAYSSDVNSLDDSARVARVDKSP